MSKFIIYTYQFFPIKNTQYECFGDKYSDDELMKRKQDIFSSIISNKELIYKRRNKTHGHKLLMNKDDVLVFRIANSKKLTLENNFKKQEHDYTPSCLVVIDNRKDVQRIAIEDDQKAFGDTTFVSNILLSTYNRNLEKYGLGISIQREYEKNEFWSVIKKYPEKITMIRFHISYPNLPRLNSSVKDLIATTNKSTNSKSTTIEYKAHPGESLTISEDDQNINDLSQVSADGGDEIQIKAKNIKSFICTGNTYKSFECENLEASIDGDLFQRGSEKLIEILNNFIR